MNLRLYIAIFMLLALFPGSTILNGPKTASALAYEYIFPLPDSNGINPETTIAFRMGTNLTQNDLKTISLQCTGSVSGTHTGELILSDDMKTVIFKPDHPFTLGETVTVTIQPTLSFSFQIRTTRPESEANQSWAAQAAAPSARAQTAAPSPNRVVSDYVTLPADFPAIEITTPANGTSDGYLFLASFPWLNPPPIDQSSFLLILDDLGEPVYYAESQPGLFTFDFKKQPNGRLSYFDGDVGGYVVLDNSYQITDAIFAGNGYPSIDFHELQLFPNGHALLMIYDNQIVDMTAYGGSLTATVQGLVIQELDAFKNVVFEWRSWDHIPLTDSYVDLTTPSVDYIHGNAIELDHDGNILISSRHTHEITKINRQTGAVIWRLGGKSNQFIFPNDAGFSWQHDIRRLPNGNITLFDNRSTSTPTYSRAVEYSLDETSLIATRVWEYRDPLDTFGFFMGSVQRLPNGNTLIGWGSGIGTGPLPGSPVLSEIKSDGSKAFEMTLPNPYVSYRAFRFPWHATPYWSPTLVVRNEGENTSLYYSWNGATDIQSYKIYASGKDNPVPFELVATQPKTGFEDSTVLPGQLTHFCYFRVMPVDNLGRETRASEITPNPACFPSYEYFMPLISQE